MLSKSKKHRHYIVLFCAIAFSFSFTDKVLCSEDILHDKYDLFQGNSKESNDWFLYEMFWHSVCGCEEDDIKGFTRKLNEVKNMAATSSWEQVSIAYHEIYYHSNGLFINSDHFDGYYDYYQSLAQACLERAIHRGLVIIDRDDPWLDQFVGFPEHVMIFPWIHDRDVTKYFRRNITDLYINSQKRIARVDAILFLAKNVRDNQTLATRLKEIITLNNLNETADSTNYIHQDYEKILLAGDEQAIFDSYFIKAKEVPFITIGDRLYPSEVLLVIAHLSKKTPEWRTVFMDLIARLLIEPKEGITGNDETIQKKPFFSLLQVKQINQYARAGISLEELENSLIKLIESKETMSIDEEKRYHLLIGDINIARAFGAYNLGGMYESNTAGEKLLIDFLTNRSK